MQFKIVGGGTPTSGKGLCHTCKHAAIVRGQNMEESIICHGGMFGGDGESGGVVRFRVAECAKYHLFTQPWLWEMREIAWNIEARKRGPAGFGDAVKGEDVEIVVTPPVKQRGYAPTS